jgi:hypothetical protein
MDMFSILAMTGAGAAIAGVAMSVTRLILKKQAQKKLADGLHHAAADNLIAKMAQTQDPNELKTLRAELDQAVQTVLQSLPQPDQERILEGLNRPSEDGRTEYIKNVLSHPNKLSGAK